MIKIAEEKNFENRIKQFLKTQNAWVLKTWGGGLQRSGIPDLLCCVHGKFVGIEVKATKGKPSELQLWNIKKIKEAGGIAMVLYPKDFEDFKKLILDLKEEKNAI